MPDAKMSPAGEAVPDLDLATDEAIAIYSGDARAAVKALLVMNNALERELELALVAVSSGFSRGWHRGLKRDA